MSKNNNKKEPVFGNCLTHGYTEFTRKGACKECSKYKRLWNKRYRDNSKYGSLNVTEVYRLPHKEEETQNGQSQ